MRVCAYVCTSANYTVQLYALYTHLVCAGTKYCTLRVCRHTPTAAGAAVEYNFNGGRTHRIALLLLSWETVATRQDAGLGLAPAGSGLGIEQKP